MQGRAITLIGIALVWLAGPAFPQEKGPAKKDAGAVKKDAGTAKAKAGDSPVNWDYDPQFKMPKGKESFKASKELFDLEKYRDAISEMKKAKDQAKTPQDKAFLEKWVGVCEGGAALGNYRTLAEKGMPRKALFMALDMGERYRDTPIYPRYVAFTDELRPKVVEVLEDFEMVSDRFSKKYGKEFIADPAIVFRGTHSLLWTSTKEGKVSQLQLDKDIPKKWIPEYHSLVFWVRTDGYPVGIRLMTKSPSKGQEKGQETPVMYADFTPPAKQGWSRAEVELSEFRKNGAGSLANVEKFIFQIDSKSAFKLYIDDVFLTRKEPSERAGAGESGPEETKKSGKASKTKTGKIKQTERKTS